MHFASSTNTAKGLGPTCFQVSIEMRPLKSVGVLQGVQGRIQNFVKHLRWSVLENI